jgi:hypothetical protein
MNWAPRHCTLRFHEIGDLEIALACGVDSCCRDKETSNRFRQFSWSDQLRASQVIASFNQTGLGMRVAPG